MWAGQRHSRDFLRMRNWGRAQGILLRHGERETSAGRAIRDALCLGSLTLRVRPRAGAPPSPEAVVPPDVAKRLVHSRGVLGDVPFRAPLDLLNDGRRALHFALENGELVVDADEWDRWLRRERLLKQWPSQHDAKRLRSRGRPGKGNEALRGSILRLVDAGLWEASLGIKKLKVLLLRDGAAPPSETTLGRFVDSLHKSIGDGRLARRHNRARRRT